MVTNFAVFAVLVASFVLILLLNYWQASAEKSSRDESLLSYSKIIGYIAGFSVSGVHANFRSTTFWT